MYEERLSSKANKTFSKEVEFKKYLHSVSDAGSRLLFEFTSGGHGLMQGRECRVLYGSERKGVVDVVWKCPALSSRRFILFI